MRWMISTHVYRWLWRKPFQTSDGLIMTTGSNTSSSSQTTSCWFWLICWSPPVTMPKTWYGIISATFTRHTLIFSFKVNQVIFPSVCISLELPKIQIPACKVEEFPGLEWLKTQHLPEEQCHTTHLHRGTRKDWSVFMYLAHLHFYYT